MALGFLHRLVRVVTPLVLGFVIGSALSLFVFRLSQGQGLLSHCTQSAPSTHTLPPSTPSIFDVVQQNAISEHFEAIIRQTISPTLPAIDDSPPASGKAPVANANPANNKPKLVRPRFFATEVGMRDKLLVAVLVTDNDWTVANAINHTSSHHVSKLIYFVTGDQHDLHEHSQDQSIIHLNWQPHNQLMEVLAYMLNRRIAVNYDWVFLMTDRSYVKAFKLHELVSHMSIGQAMYLGTPMAHYPALCDIRAGVLLSQELLLQMQNHLHDCHNLMSPSVASDVNLGSCLQQVLNRTCTNQRSGKQFRSYSVGDGSGLERCLSGDVSRHEQDSFNTAHVIYPITSAADIYHLHAHSCQLELQHVAAFDKVLTKHMQELSPETPERNSWPPGLLPSSRPHTRFEVPKWEMFNSTHIFKNDAEQNSERMNALDLTDINQMTDQSRTHIDGTDTACGWHAQFLALHSGYRMFDPNRGMSYVLDLLYEAHDLGAQQMCRVHAIRPLTRTEIVHEVPYVTEDTNITMIVPVDMRLDMNAARQFLQRYGRLCLGGYPEKRVTQVFLVVTGDASQLQHPVLDQLHAQSQMLNERCAGTAHFELLYVQSPTPTVSVTGHRAVIQTVIERVGNQQLLLYTTVWTELDADLLNRVRLNTIKHYQVFFPIAFRQFEPAISGKGRDLTALLDNVNGAVPMLLPDNDFLMPLASEQDEQTVKVEVHKDVGRFDPDDFSYAAFYGADYEQQVQGNSDPSLSLVQVFLHSELHVMRAVEPHLLVHHHEQLCEPSLPEQDYALCTRTRRLGLASKAQLAVLVLAHNDKQRLAEDNRVY